MNVEVHIDTEALIREATRYLLAVDAFRAEHCEPMWQSELVPSDAFGPESARRVTSGATPESQRS